MLWDCRWQLWVVVVLVAVDGHAKQDLLRHDEDRTLGIGYQGRPERMTALSTFTNRSKDVSELKFNKQRLNFTRVLAAPVLGNWNNTPIVFGACYTECKEDDAHCVYVEYLPADFCEMFSFPLWCTSNINQPWCVCKDSFKEYTAAKGKCEIVVDRYKS